MRLALTALAVSRCNLPKKSADGESRQRLFEYRTSKIERCHGLVPWYFTFSANDQDKRKFVDAARLSRGGYSCANKYP